MTLRLEVAIDRRIMSLLLQLFPNIASFAFVWIDDDDVAVTPIAGPPSVAKKGRMPVTTLWLLLT